MAIKISEMNPVVFAEMADQKEVNQGGVTFSETNLDVFTLYQPGATATITSTTTLSAPLPHVIFLNPSAAGQIITLPALTAANHARLGDLIKIVNAGNFSVELRYSDASTLPSSPINPATISDYTITTVGTPGVVRLADTINTVPFNIVTGTSHTLVITDANGTVAPSNTGGDSTVTIPPNADVAFPSGTIITILNRTGSRLVTVQPGSGVTLVNELFTTSAVILDSFGYLTIQKSTSNTWIVKNYVTNLITTSDFTWGASTVTNHTITLMRNNNQVTIDIPLLSFSAAVRNSTVVSINAFPARYRPAMTVPDVGYYDLGGTGALGRYVVVTGGTLLFQTGGGAAFDTGGLSQALAIDPFYWTYRAAA
jgi:hypothetical protein